jgi:hypothetical protein
MDMSPFAFPIVEPAPELVTNDGTDLIATGNWMMKRRDVVPSAKPMPISVVPPDDTLLLNA